MAYTNRGDFISQASERSKTFRFFQGVRLLPMPSLKKMSTDGWGGEGEIKQKLGSRGQIFANFWPVFVFWTLLLNIQTAVTSSILGVRGSSLDSRELSATHFSYTPLVTQENEKTKKITWPQTDSRNMPPFYILSLEDKVVKRCHSTIFKVSGGWDASVLPLYSSSSWQKKFPKSQF